MNKYYAPKTDEITKRETDHMALVRKAAGECMVLMKNDGTLPLKAGTKVALFGSGAANTIKGGTGSGDVNSRFVVSIAEGLTEGGFTVTTADWLERQKKAHEQSREDYLSLLHEIAVKENGSELMVSFSHPYKEPAPIEITDEDVTDSETDTAIFVISRNSGEGADRDSGRGDYMLYEEELARLRFLSEKYSKLILVLNIGGVIDMSEINGIKGINSVLLMSQLGNVGGLALADVLNGRLNPSGKLADTWAARYSDYPSSETFSHNDGDVDDEFYTEGIFTGYRYFDTFGIKPLYRFGYGMSYTGFSLEPEGAELNGTSVAVKVKVTNTGDTYSGKEVVQVYYSAPAGELVKPVKELAGFKKTGLLSPGESETVTVSFDAKDMASYSEEKAAWVLEKGDYRICVGADSGDIMPAAVITLDETAVTFKTANLFKKDIAFEELIPPVSGNAGCDKASACAADFCPAASADRGAFSAENISRLNLKASDIKSVAAEYQKERTGFSTDKTEKLTVSDVKAGKCSVEEVVAQLTVEEMASLCVGTLRAGEGQIVGNSSGKVPGAAADTFPIDGRGIKNMITADGPAGLRLQPVFKTSKDGELLPGGDMIGDIITPFDPDLKDEDVETYYQYCTAMPIGWALAQSWDEALLTELGDMVGTEMELFHVDLWLAPAMNIHRNPLCGRNFEYYSEDPLVAGKAAAAITKGLQSHEGKGVTIKHFALNNQEDNRYFTNSHVSERAAREIYLKGFEIAVRESSPLSVMTSYNLINGTHSANCRDLLQSALRDEWGFKGLVMTDWFSSQYMPGLTGNTPVKYPIAASTGCVYAGNDLQMPGCKGNVDDIVKAVETGEELDGYKLTRADLQQAAANILRIVVKTTA